MNDEFYIGYVREVPRGISGWVRRTVAALGLGACALAIVVAAGQGPFAPATFEFGMEREFTGVVSADPHPVLFNDAGAHVLFGPGKRGFTPPIVSGSAVRIRGSAVSLGDARGIEVVSLAPADASAAPPPRVDLGMVALVGEIVDSKCYFGVMNPGRGKVHRDCAVRCISGGIPPALLVNDGAGKLRTVLLTGVPIPDLLPNVAERVRVSGRLSRAGSLLLIEALPSGVQRE